MAGATLLHTHTVVGSLIVRIEEFVTATRCNRGTSLENQPHDAFSITLTRVQDII